MGLHMYVAFLYNNNRVISTQATFAGIHLYVLLGEEKQLW